MDTKMIISIKKMLLLAVFVSLIGLFLVNNALAECQENWQCNAWQKCFDGLSERNCYDLNSCNTAITKTEVSNCSLTLPYCYDIKINQDESDVDCGGKICQACNDGKSCLRNEDCANNQCNNGICGIEETSPTPAPTVQSDRGPVIVVFVILGIAMLLFARRAFGRKKETIINPKNVGNAMVIFEKTKKDRWGKFKANFKEYLKSIAPVDLFGFGNLQKEKGLLNKSELKASDHPTKQWMLSNLKEAYG